MEFRQRVWLENVSACGVVCCCCQASGPADSSVGVSRLTYGAPGLILATVRRWRGAKGMLVRRSGVQLSRSDESACRGKRVQKVVRLGSRSSGGNDGSLTSSLRFQVSGCGPVSEVGLLLAERGKLRRSIRQAQAGWQERDRRSARRARSTVCTEGIGRVCVCVCVCIVFGKRGTLRTAVRGREVAEAAAAASRRGPLSGGREGKREKGQKGGVTRRREQRWSRDYEHRTEH